jgi:hypothetical protein
MKSDPRAFRKLAFVCLALLIVAGISGWWLGRDRGGSVNQDTPVGARDGKRPAEPVALVNKKDEAINMSKDIEPASASAPAARALQARLNGFADQLSAITKDTTLSADEKGARARDVLKHLRDELRNAPADVAATAIMQYLDGGADASTGLGFVVEAGGVLSDTPSMRTSLLDMLGQVDPGASVDYAQKIFAASQIPDEWALAMRNLGWQNQEGAHTPELRQRLNQMLDNQTWLAKPSQGFLEAFDIAVHLGGAGELINMASVTRLQTANGQAVEAGTTHAAYVAMDRITTQKPAVALTALADDPTLLAWAPEHRASLMARADVSDAAQRAAVEAYLQSIAANPKELETFTSMFPNRNGLLGNALITTQRQIPTFAQIAAQDKAALAAVQQWQASGQYPALAANLQQIATRLTGFVNDAAASAGR